MRSTASDRQPLVGRQDETGVVDKMIGAVRLGQGGVLVLRGEAGIGKSALLQHAQQAASGFLVVHANGSEFESELPFATLHQLCRQLCAPALGYLDELSARHQEVLNVAFGWAAGTPDVLRVGLAILELMAAAARKRPLLCVVDDAHWLDAASLRALAFVARRIEADPVVLLMAARPSGSPDELDELPGLDVGRLSDGEARALLAATSQAPLDEQVRERIVAEARGNPLALLQLPDAGGFALPDTSLAPTRIERSFQARMSALAEPARMLLTIASADPTGDPGLLWPAVQRMGIDVTATSAAAAASGLVAFSTRVRFGHPLARSAVYLAADDDQRRTAHQVLAEVTDPDLDPDRRAWHRAKASAGPDEEVAAELERSASRARSRGGVVAAAAFLERAAELSLVTGKRIARTLAAAQARFDVGALDAATALLATVENASLDEHQYADLDLLRGRIAFVRHHDQDGTDFMLAAIRGRRQEAEELIETAKATARDTDQLLANVHWAAAVLGNSLAEYPAALTAARQVLVHDDLFISALALPELVEAAVRCGKHEEAATALEELTAGAEANGTATALGVAAYARGLVTGVEDHYREALDRLAESPALPYRARAHLLYGEWLRRENRWKECRPQLHTAHELLSEAGLEAFAERAARELLATGEKPRGRSGQARDQLTMQEVHIARLVAAGGTSAAVATRLFISPRTVDAHLRNIFRKLDITSRKQLRNWPDLRTAVP